MNQTEQRTELHPSDRLRRQEAVIWRKLDDEVVVLNEDGTKLTSLNESAALLWTLLDGDHTVDDLVGALIGRYRVASDRARDDVIEFCEGLLDAGLAEVEIERCDSD